MRVRPLRRRGMLAPVRTTDPAPGGASGLKADVGSASVTGARRISLTLMLASGFAGLGYQIVWTQQCALWLGHESAAVLAVLAAFFGGLALGALVFGPGIERSRKPLRCYAACEAVIAVWGAMLILAMQPYSEWMLSLTGGQPSAVRQWTVAFCGTFLLLLPATAAMGATLPAMERVLAGWQHSQRCIARLYAANTLGAVCGVLAAAFCLVPELGLTATTALCVALNAVCAWAAWRWLSAPLAGHGLPTQDKRYELGLALFGLAASGFLGIGYEVMVVRVVSQLAEDTVYTFAVLLAVYLLGSAAGAAVYQRMRPRGTAFARVAGLLLSGLACACLIGTAGLYAGDALKVWAARNMAGSLAGAIGAEALLALVAFGLPTVCMGAAFSHLSRWAAARGAGFGRAIGANTLGAAFAPAVFGVWLTPAFGAKAALLAVAAGYAVLAAISARRLPRLACWPLALILAVALWAPPLRFVELAPGGRLASYREGAMAAVSVVEDADGVVTLRINNRQQEGSSATGLVDGRQGMLPLLLHPAPQRALFLGLGTGVTAATAAEDRALQVDAVELLPEVAQAARFFQDVAAGGAPARLHLQIADARRFVRTSRRQYDVVVADNFHPARSGSGALYTLEHFRAVRERLAPGGLFCQWLPLHQLDADTLRSIVATFLAVYPHGWAMLASNSLQTPVVGLLARNDGRRFDLAAIRQRLAANDFGVEPADYGFEDEWALLGSFQAGPAALARFSGNAPLNTDDRPVVAYRAPRITYLPDSQPGDRLLTLLQEWSLQPGELLQTEDSESSDRLRLAAYWSAGKRYLQVGRNVRPLADPGAMLTQVREPLLAVLRTSADFRPAYAPLLNMAMALASRDSSAAITLLRELARLQPARPEAAEALRRLESGAFESR